MQTIQAATASKARRKAGVERGLQDQLASCRSGWVPPTYPSARVKVVSALLLLLSAQPGACAQRRHVITHNQRRVDLSRHTHRGHYQTADGRSSTTLPRLLGTGSLPLEPVTSRSPGAAKAVQVGERGNAGEPCDEAGAHKPVHAARTSPLARDARLLAMPRQWSDLVFVVSSRWLRLQRVLWRNGQRRKPSVAAHCLPEAITDCRAIGIQLLHGHDIAASRSRAKVRAVAQQVEPALWASNAEKPEDHFSRFR